MDDSVYKHGDYNDYADDYIAKRERRACELETVIEHAPDKCTYDGSEEHTLSAHGADSADNGRGDSIELIVRARVHAAHAALRGEYQADNAGEERRNDINFRLRRGDIDSGQARRLIVRAEGIDMPAECRL